MAVFSAEADNPRPPTESEAADVVAESDAKYLTEGARSEFCRSRGVDYDRYRRCATDVRALERAMRLEPASPPPSADEIVAMLQQQQQSRPDASIDLSVECINDDFGLVRVRVKWLSEEAHETLERFGRCPLCLDTGHNLRMCPHLPDELRPFS